jgi:hypothetical protein
MKIDYKAVMQYTLKQFEKDGEIIEGLEDEDWFIEDAKRGASLMEKKLKKLLKKFPILKGPHEAKVKHPYELWGVAWIDFSAKVQAKGYAKYCTFVENAAKAAKKKKASSGFGLFGVKAEAKASGPKPLVMTEEDEELFEAQWAETSAQIAAYEEGDGEEWTP